MSYGFRNTGLMVIHSYAQAKRMLEGTKKIRGRADDQIPLGRRDRVDQFRINLDPKTLDVLLIWYQTPVVTWHPDNSITVKADRWNTASTANFIDETTGMSTRRFNHNMCVISTRGKEYVVPTTGLRFVKAEGAWEPVNPEQRMVHKLNRRAYNNVRSRYAEFIKYYMGMAKLREGNVVPAEEIGDDKDAGVNLNPLSAKFDESANELRTRDARCQPRDAVHKRAAGVPQDVGSGGACSI